MKYAYAIRAMKGQIQCGDAIYVREDPGRMLFAVIDGLGHGAGAHASSVKAVETLAASSATDAPVVLLDRCHEALRGMRGAAAAILSISGQTGAFAGIGNIEVTSKSKNKLNLLSYPGIVGRKIRKSREFEFTVSPGDILALFSDGITKRLSLDCVDGPDTLQARADQLLELYGRDHDDASLLLIYA